MHDIERTVLGVIAVATLALAFIVGGTNAVENTVPQCAEDAVLVGTGAFEHGRYERYVCGSAVDD